MRFAALLVTATYHTRAAREFSGTVVVSGPSEKRLRGRLVGGSTWLPCRTLVVFMGDSHMRQLWMDVQHAAGCNMSHVSKSDSYGNTFVCRAPCNTSLVFMWSVSSIRIDDLSASDNCTYAASLDCRAQEISEYVRSGCKASAPQLLNVELARLQLGVPDLIVSNLPQWLLSAEGLHNGHERPRYYTARAQHAGCVSQFKEKMLASYRVLHSAATHGLVVCNHLDLARWGGVHLEGLFFGPLQERGVPVVRMQDAWRQASDDDSHIRSPTVNLELWRRVAAAARIRSGPSPARRLSTAAKEGRYIRRRSVDYGHWEREEAPTVPGATVLKNGSFLACTSGNDRFRYVNQGPDVLRWKYVSKAACGGPCVSIGPRDAQRCLANLWIHLDGDSISRDMYFDLLDLLDPLQSRTCTRAKLHHGTGFTAAAGTLVTLGWNFALGIGSKLNSSSTSWTETAASAAAHNQWRHRVQARRADPVAPDVWVFSPGLWFGAFGKLDHHLYKEVIARVRRDAEAHRNTTAFYMRAVTPYAKRRDQIDDDHAWMYECTYRALDPSTPPSHARTARASCLPPPELDGYGSPTSQMAARRFRSNRAS